MPKLIDVCISTIENWIPTVPETADKPVTSKEIQWGLIGGMHPRKALLVVFTSEKVARENVIETVSASEVRYPVIGRVLDGEAVFECEDDVVKRYFNSTGKRFLEDPSVQHKAKWCWAQEKEGMKREEAERKAREEEERKAREEAERKAREEEIEAQKKREKNEKNRAKTAKRRETAKANKAAATAAVTAGTTANQPGPTQGTAAATTSEETDDESAPAATDPTPSATSPAGGVSENIAGRHDPTSTEPRMVDESEPEPSKPEPVVKLPYAAVAAKEENTSSSGQAQPTTPRETKNVNIAAPKPAPDAAESKIQHGPQGSFKYHERVFDARDTPAPPTLKISNSTATKDHPPTVQSTTPEKKMFTLTREEANGETGPKPRSTGPTYEQLQALHDGNVVTMWACQARRRRLGVEMPKQSNSAAVQAQGEEARNEENQWPGVTSRPRFQFGGVDELAEDHR